MVQRFCAKFNALPAPSSACSSGANGAPSSWWGPRPWCYCCTVTQFDKDSVVTWTQYDPVIWQRSLQTTIWMEKYLFWSSVWHAARPKCTVISINNPKSSPVLQGPLTRRCLAKATPALDPQFPTTLREVSLGKSSPKTPELSKP